MLILKDLVANKTGLEIRSFDASFGLKLRHLLGFAYALGAERPQGCALLYICSTACA